MSPKAMKANKSKTSKSVAKNTAAKSKAKAQAKVMAMKATMAMKAEKAMAAKDKGMKAKLTKTKFWSATWTGLYYFWELVGLKWEKGHVLETWDLTLRPGWKESKAMKTMKAMKAMKAKK
jgi:hypothetical protein